MPPSSHLDNLGHQHLLMGRKKAQRGPMFFLLESHWMQYRAEHVDFPCSVRLRPLSGDCSGLLHVPAVACSNELCHRILFSSAMIKVFTPILICSEIFTVYLLHKPTC